MVKKFQRKLEKINISSQLYPVLGILDILGLLGGGWTFVNNFVVVGFGEITRFFLGTQEKHKKSMLATEWICFVEGRSSLELEG